MRPLLLELTGFGVFRDPVSVDFTDLDFFALVGDTGAGKSTVLDAICFALYGNVPRYDDQRLVGAAMSLGANEARVRLTFEAGDQRYVVVRVVRRGAQNRVSTKEARLERVGDGAVLAGRESELRTEVERIVGLGFDDFTRCVVLPQGAFARFLHDKPAERQALLVRLLELGVYARLVNRANARASEHQRTVDRLAGQLTELPDASPDDLDSAEEAVARLILVGELADAAEPRAAELEAQLEHARRSASAAEATLVSLGAVRVPPELLRQAELGAALSEQLAQAEAEAASAADRLEVHERVVQTLGDLTRIDQVLAIHERIVRGEAVVATRADELAAARAAAEAAGVTRSERDHELAAATARHDALHAAHRAHAIAVTLRPGDPCPVCEQMVTTLPLPSPPAALALASDELARADRSYRAAVEAAVEADRLVVRSESAWGSASERLAELRDEVAGWPPVAELQAQRAATAVAYAELEVLRAAARDASQRAVRARTDVQRLAEAQRSVAGEYHRQRDALVALGPPSPPDDLSLGWTELAEWAATQRPEIEADLTAARADAEAARSAGRDLLAGLTEAAIRCGLELPKPPTLSSIRQAVVRADGEARRHLDSLHRSVERRAELLAAARLADDARSVAHELARQLKTDRFQRWLVEATFHDLADRASTTLRRLSSGQFSLRVIGSTGEFAVVDHLAADEERSVRTLSGGETFQASLALALALSDHVMEVATSRGHHRLESIFLDEGFGTLDPATLDTVASTIETLGTDGRMVGIVTHVTELAERVPVRFRVTKGARGSTITRENS